MNKTTFCGRTVVSVPCPASGGFAPNPLARGSALGPRWGHSPRPHHLQPEYLLFPSPTKGVWIKPCSQAHSSRSSDLCPQDNKSSQSNLGKGPRRCESLHVRRKVPIGYNGAPQKVPLPVDRSPNATTCLIPGPVRPMMPNGIEIRSAVYPQCTGQTDAQTDRSSTGKFDDYMGRCALRSTRPNNN